jgi:hypothetical protein
MIAGMKTPFVSLLVIFAATALAQDMPVPKMFRDLQGQKGQYQVEILDGGGRATKDQMRGKAPTMTLCTDNLMDVSSRGDKPRAESGCKHRLLKDTADEALIESTCAERKSTVTLKREGKSMLMTTQTTGPRGPQEMKMRYTHLGPCREGQGMVTLDSNSEECKKIKEQAARLDPAKQCASAKSDRQTCEQRVREAAAQLSAMCG